VTSSLAMFEDAIRVKSSIWSNHVW